jgi:uncharacterized protein (TIGR02266 family)
MERKAEALEDLERFLVGQEQNLLARAASLACEVDAGQDEPKRLEDRLSAWRQSMGECMLEFAHSRRNLCEQYLRRLRRLESEMQGFDDLLCARQRQAASLFGRVMKASGSLESSGRTDEAADQRRALRVVLDAVVTLDSETNFVAGSVRNLSVGGLFVATPHLLASGREVDLCFRLPGEPEIRTRGAVAWRRQGDPAAGLQPGLGIRFLDLSDEDCARIQRFAGKRAPLTPAS